MAIALRKQVQPIQKGLDVSIQLDTSETNPQAKQFAKKLGFKRIFDTARMYKGVKPKMNEKIIFGLNSLEIR